eukprot:jgi/Botrbrau1/15141/Bobra.0149s0012.3
MPKTSRNLNHGLRLTVIVRMKRNFGRSVKAALLMGNAEPKDEPSTSLAKWMRKEGDSRSRNVGGHQRGRIQWPWRVPQIEPIQIQDKGWSSRRVALACRRTWQAHWQAVGAAPAWTWLLRLTLLALFHRFRPKLAARLELFCLAIPFMDALGALLGQEACSLSLPGGLRRIGRQAALGTWPCLALSAWRGATSWRVERRPRPRLKRTTSMCVAELAKDFDERESRRSSLQLSIEGVQEGLALAQSYSTELAELRRILSSSGTRLPPNRFDETGAELMRFAAAAGIEKATGAEASAVALEEAAHRVYATIRWARKQRFMPLAQLKQWTHVVQYEGRDEQGHPIMLVRAAQACELRQGRPSEQAVQAIVSMVEYITHTVMEEGGGSDRMLVVVDACDASTLHVTRKVSRIKGLVLTLMQHYPNRLHRLDIVGLPPVLRWVYTTLRPQLANITAAKVRMCEPGDTTVPVLVGQGLTSKKRTLSAPSRIYEAIAKEAVAEGDLALAGTPRREPKGPVEEGALDSEVIFEEAALPPKRDRLLRR